jgi:hypothetical protein
MPGNIRPPLLFDEMMAFQRELIRVSLVPIKNWPKLAGKLHYRELILDPPSIQLDLVDGLLQGVCVTYEGLWACSAVLWFQKAAGAEYKLCSRPDCASLFTIQSQHARKYCSTNCAHVSAVRAARRRNATMLKQRQKVLTRSDRSKRDG